MGEGYDVLTTAYSYDEFRAMLQWAKRQFMENNLPIPTGYRAGGWFADEKILAALDDEGFVYDSSARERTMWNGNGQSPWDINSTTQPYHPSRQDQNTSGADNLGLLEIPNNGADCYGYGVDELKRKFVDNFDRGPQTEKKVVTYLSHAQWQNDDENKMEEVLDMTDDWAYVADRGPVVYVTLDQIWEIWN
jgi:hypothetical protein